MEDINMQKRSRGGRCNLKDPMRRITKISGGYWVRFIRNSKVIRHEQFYFSRWETEENALIHAKSWRDMIEREMDDNGLLETNWNDTAKFHIIGISWVQRTDRNRFVDELKAYCSKPKEGFCKVNSFSITKHGLKGALDLAIENLEQKRTKIPYPEKVKRKAYNLLKKEYKQFSVANIS